MVSVAASTRLISLLSGVVAATLAALSGWNLMCTAPSSAKKHAYLPLPPFNAVRSYTVLPSASSSQMKRPSRIGMVSP